MAEFGGNGGGGGGGGGFEDNWDLQAIVRGGSSTMSTASAFFPGPDSCYLDNTNIIPQINDDINNGDFFFSFPNDNLSFTDDLQDLYKPFYPFSDSSSSSSLVVQGDHIPFGHKNEFKEELQVYDVVPKQQLSPPPPHTDATVNISQTPKYRRRKNQNKRVVVQAAGAEGLPSDTWAWRKYGQKPIKGSPYPRSYYRCSTSRGCLARKQVEQSCTDQGVFIISYAAEHNHAQPIKKNALAGTTRQKFPTQINPTAPWTYNNNVATASEYKENSCNSNWSSSAPSPMSAASNIEDGCSSDIKQENINSDIKIEEEFFAGLEDLDGLISELTSTGQHHYSSQMFSMNFYR